MRAVTKRAFIWVPLVLACSDLPTVDTRPTPYGGVKAYVALLGYHVDPNGSDSIVVALDSAISGYGLQRILSSDDSAMFNPVLVGTHETTLRGIPSSCDLTSGPATVGFHVDTAEAVIFIYFLRCGTFR